MTVRGSRVNWYSSKCMEYIVKVKEPTAILGRWLRHSVLCSCMLTAVGKVGKGDHNYCSSHLERSNIFGLKIEPGFAVRDRQ